MLNARFPQDKKYRASNLLPVAKTFISESHKYCKNDTT